MGNRKQPFGYKITMGEVVIHKEEADAINITEWDESVIRQMVETVKVLSKNEIIVTLKGGAEINQRLE